MIKSAVLSTTAIALILCATPATAQLQQKAPEEKGTPSQAGPGRESAPQKGASPEQPRNGTAQSEPSDKARKGTAEKAPEPKDKSTKGAAERVPEPKDKASKGTAGRDTEPRDKATKGAAEKGGEPKEKAAGAEPKDGTARRVQVSEQQRTTVSQTLLKDRSVNRISNVNFSVNIGTRVPRSVRLVALPAAVIAIVPEYRSFRYFVVNEQICIVDPNSYEIVEVISVSTQRADRDDRGSSARLVLTEQEKTIVLREVDLRGDSTLALGALSEGADVPRNIELRVFPEAVVEKVPKLKGYKFFTAENRLAIVDAQGAKIQLVIMANR